MSRAPFRRKSGAREANQLVRLAEGLASSKSRAEDVYWERELEAAVTLQLENNDEDVINRTLDKAHDAPDATFDALADMVESLTESIMLDSEKGPQRVTLFCAPILVWGRKQIPAKTIPKAQLQNIAVQLSAHVFSSKAKIALADFMFAPDQRVGWNACGSDFCKCEANSMIIVRHRVRRNLFEFRPTNNRQRNRALRKRPQQLLVHRHQLSVELQRKCDEFTVVR